MQCARPTMELQHRRPPAPSSLPRGRTCAIMYVACLFFSPVVGGCGRVIKAVGQVFRRERSARETSRRATRAAEVVAFRARKSSPLMSCGRDRTLFLTPPAAVWPRRRRSRGRRSAPWTWFSARVT